MRYIQEGVRRALFIYQPTAVGKRLVIVSKVWKNEVELASEIASQLASMLTVMGNRAEEKKVFESFINKHPLFASDRVMKWCQPKNDPPDVRCYLIDGRKIDIELTSWLKESQIRCAKKQESLEQSIRDAIKPEPPNQTEHICLVWMIPKCWMLATDASAFRAELLKLVEEIDSRWDSVDEWHLRTGFPWKDFSDYPMLGTYLEEIFIRLRIPSLPTTMKKSVPNWLTFRDRGKWYSPNWMVDALCERVQAKIAQYPAKPTRTNEFYLLVHYDKAWQYNTPATGIGFGYAEAVRDAAARIGNSAGVFDRILVFVPLAEEDQVFSLYPA